MAGIAPACNTRPARQQSIDRIDQDGHYRTIRTLEYLFDNVWNDRTKRYIICINISSA